MAAVRQRAGEDAEQNVANSESEKKTLPPRDRVTIILVHGFMAPSYSQNMLQWYLNKEGWSHIEKFVYDSKSETIEFHGQKLAEFVAAIAEKRPDHEIYFLATSMGNLLLRVAWHCEEMPESAKRGRHVAVGPPWRGASWGRAVNGLWIARKISGDGPGRQLCTTPMDGFDYMGDSPKEVDTLVITGNASYNIFISSPNDGTVTLEETYLRTPHWRSVVPWGVHALLNWSIVTCRLSHQFFSGSTDGLEFHPGLIALEAEKSVADDKKTQ